MTKQNIPLTAKSILCNIEYVEKVHTQTRILKSLLIKVYKAPKDWTGPVVTLKKNMAANTNTLNPSNSLYEKL